MAGITPQQMVQNIQDELHDDSLGSERVYRWINTVQEDIDSRTYWHHLEKIPPYQFRTLPPYSTGTVTVTNGSATVVGSGTAFTAAMVGMPFQGADDEDYYYVQAVPDGTTLTLASPYLGDSAAGATYSVYFPSYDLPDDISVQKIKSVLIQNPHFELEYIDVKERNELYPNLLTGFGQPTCWMDWGPSNIQFWPVPDGYYNLLVRYQMRPVEVSDSVAAFSWPAQMHRTIEMGAKFHGWSWKDDNLALEIKGVYEQMLQAHIIENNKRSPNKMVLRAFDEQSSIGRFALVLGRRITP